MASLVTKLNAILKPKYELMAGARADVLFLRAELESMHAFLDKLSAVRDPSAQVKAWTKEVRELAYDIEDTMDEFMRRVDYVHGSGPFGSSRGLLDLAGRVTRLVSTAWTHLHLTGELKGLKARAVEVSERRSRYRFGGEDDVWASGDRMVADPRINVLYAGRHRWSGDWHRGLVGGWNRPSQGAVRCRVRRPGQDDSRHGSVPEGREAVRLQSFRCCVAEA